jgi:uncharacterized protein YceH (UPF0502 family)
MLPQNLDPAEVRVLGSLIEKELSTPDHYPLSLNALVSACNQSSNRDPVSALAVITVENAIDTLRRQGLVRSFQGSGERVPKFQHLLAQADARSRAELATLCVLMLRGPQTLAEVRTRAQRLVPQVESGDIDSAVEKLIARDPMPAIIRLARRPGQKEARYSHLLAGEVALQVGEENDAAGAESRESGDRVAALEAVVDALRAELADLRAEFQVFRTQFE